jgi:SAM-dependent methyltransferase
VYDLGCSTGTTMIVMNETVPGHMHFVGIDDSQAMLDKCRTKLQEAGFTRPFSLEVADLNGNVEIENAWWWCFVSRSSSFDPFIANDSLKNFSAWFPAVSSLL